MEMPKEESSSEALLETFGDFHIPALKGAGSTTQAVLDAFQPRQDGLANALAARKGAAKALAGAEALRIAAEVDVEATLTRLELIMLGSVGKKRDKDPYKTSYPKGVPGAIEPRGAAQAAEATRIADYLAPAQGAAPAGVPAEAAPVIVELRTATTVLSDRVKTETAAQAAYETAWLSELSERRRWREQYRKDHGLLTAIYGNDKKKIESFFKKVARGNGKKEKGDGTRVVSP
jgi:hypothetical protein